MMKLNMMPAVQNSDGVDPRAPRILKSKKKYQIFFFFFLFIKRFNYLSLANSVIKRGTKVTAIPPAIPSDNLAAYK